MAWRRGQAYGQGLRDRVLAAEGVPAREVAQRLYGAIDSRAFRAHVGQMLTHTLGPGDSVVVGPSAAKWSRV